MTQSNNNNNKISKAIFFDVDGTLWNALDNILKSNNETIINKYNPFHENKVNPITEEQLSSVMGLTPEESVSILFPNLDFEEGLKLFKLCVKDEVEYLKVNPGKLYDNALEVLERLKKKYPLYIVSNADKGYVENLVYNYDKDRKLFSDFIQAGDTGLSKCDNIKRLKSVSDIDKVIYVGDTKKDYVESFNAGVSFIYVTYGFGGKPSSDEELKSNPMYKYSVDSFLELEGMIEKVFNEME